MEENYYLAYNLVSQRFDKNDKLFYFYVCALYGVLCKYKDYKDFVLDVFKKCDFYLENGKVDEILKRHNINNNEYDDDYISDSECNTTFGVSNQGHEFYINEDGKVSHRLGSPFIVCSLDNVSFARLLNTFCHEFSHLVKGEVNGYDIVEEDNKIDYYIRTGLAYYYYSYDEEKDELSSSVDFSILDECINTFQTTDIMREILGLRELSGVDEGLDQFINSLDCSEMLEDCGYEEVCGVVREIWDNETFRTLVESSIVVSGVEDVEKFFDDLVGQDALFNFSELLEEAFNLSDTSNNDEKIDELKKKAADIAHKFNVNIKKMIK